MSERLWNIVENKEMRVASIFSYSKNVSLVISRMVLNSFPTDDNTIQDQNVNNAQSDL